MIIGKTRILAAILCAATIFSLYAATTDDNRAQYGKMLELVRIKDGPKRAMAAELVGAMLYVVGDEKLYIYDVATPDQPKLISTVRGLYQARQLAIKPGLVCVTARSHGMWLIDVSNPAKPVMLPRGDAIELATGIDVAGNLLFIGNRIYGVEIQDISDPRHPKYVSRIKTQEAQSVRYVNGLVFAGDWGGGLITIIDMNNPFKPTIINTIKLDGYGDGLTVRDNLLFAATGHHRFSGPKKTRYGNGHAIEIFDISNLKQPVRLSRVQFPTLWTRSNDFWTVRVAGNHAFVADTHNGLFVLDISDLRNPHPVAQALLPRFKTVSSDFNGTRQELLLGDAVSGVAIGDGVVYLTGVRSGLSLVRLPGIAKIEPKTGTVPTIPPAPPQKIDSRLYTYNAGGQVRAVAVRGDYAYVAATTGGLHLVKLTAHGIEPVKKWDIPYVYDVKLRGENQLVTAEGDGGVAIYRIEAPDQLKKIGAVSLGIVDIAQRLWLPDNSRFAVSTGHRGNVSFIDLKDPASPKVVKRHSQISIVYGDLVSDRLIGGRYLLQNWHTGGFAWYDLGGDTPVIGNLEKKRSGSGHTNGITEYKGKAFFVHHGGYSILEPNQEGPFAKWKTIASELRLAGVPRFDGDVLVISHRPTGKVNTYDFSDPAEPKRISKRCYSLNGCPDAVSFWKHKILIPAGYQGLLMEK